MARVYQLLVAAAAGRQLTCGRRRAEGFSKRFSASVSPPPHFSAAHLSRDTHIRRLPSAHRRIIIRATRARLPYRRRRHYLRTRIIRSAIAGDQCAFEV